MTIQLQHDLGEEVYYTQNNEIKKGVIQNYWLKQNVYLINDNQVPVADVGETFENTKVIVTDKITVKIAELQDKKVEVEALEEEIPETPIEKAPLEIVN